MNVLRLKLLTPLLVITALFCYWFLKTPIEVVPQADMSEIASITTAAQNMPTPQASFINAMLPAIQKANDQVLQQRLEVLRLERLYRHRHTSLSDSELLWLQTLSNDYSLKSFSVQKPQDWQTLLTRVDVIPPALAIAQAVEESQWGTSRFAKEANNFYGMRCFSHGCGMIPESRPADAHYEVKTFRDRYASVASYLHNLNTHTEYLYLRKLRAVEREHHQSLSALALVQGLTSYSTRGSAYIRTISYIIEKYQLQQYQID